MIGILALLASLQIPESQLATVQNGKEVFPVAFRGVWSKSLKDCADENSIETVEITEDRIYGYEFDSLLIKAGAIYTHSDPANRTSSTGWANSFVALTADRAETDVSWGKIRLSRLGNYLYMSQPEAVKEEEHLSLTYRNVRCPQRPPAN
jgi:hypothetical protein